MGLKQLEHLYTVKAEQQQAGPCAVRPVDLLQPDPDFGMGAGLGPMFGQHPQHHHHQQQQQWSLGSARVAGQQQPAQAAYAGPGRLSDAGSSGCAWPSSGQFGLQGLLSFSTQQQQPQQQLPFEHQLQQQLRAPAPASAPHPRVLSLVNPRAAPASKAVHARLGRELAVSFTTPNAVPSAPHSMAPSPGQLQGRLTSQLHPFIQQQQPQQQALFQQQHQLRVSAPGGSGGGGAAAPLDSWSSLGAGVGVGMSAHHLDSGSVSNLAASAMQQPGLGGARATAHHHHQHHHAQAFSPLGVAQHLEALDSPYSEGADHTPPHSFLYARDGNATPSPGLAPDPFGHFGVLEDELRLLDLDASLRAALSGGGISGTALGAQAASGSGSRSVELRASDSGGCGLRVLSPSGSFKRQADSDAQGSTAVRRPALRQRSFYDRNGSPFVGDPTRFAPSVQGGAGGGPSASAAAQQGNAAAPHSGSHVRGSSFNVGGGNGAESGEEEGSDPYNEMQSDGEENAEAGDSGRAAGSSACEPRRRHCSNRFLTLVSFGARRATVCARACACACGRGARGWWWWCLGIAVAQQQSKHG